jgi:hypothetical protein
MQEFATGALAFVGSAVFSAAVHIAGHESLHSLKLGLHKRLLRNHDVARALRESYAAALKIVEEHYLAASPGLPRHEVKRAFGDLRLRALRFFPLEGEGGPLADETIDLAVDDSRADDLAESILLVAADTPQEIRSVFREEFPQAFRYAFMQIGIKHNDTVRSAVTHELLMSLHRSAVRRDHDVEALSHELARAVARLEEQDEDQRFAAAFRDSTSRSLEDILKRVSEIADLQQAMMTAAGERPQTSSATLGYLVISDADDAPLACVRISAPDVTFGREAGCPVPLPHRSVGRAHATLKVRPGSMELEDLGSKNGTYVNGRRIDGRTPVRFGDLIGIGPFRLALRAPATPLEALVTFDTVLEH